MLASTVSTIYQRLYCYQTVSYTHLDVYKRQYIYHSASYFFHHTGVKQCHNYHPQQQQLYDRNQYCYHVS